MSPIRAILTYHSLDGSGSPISVSESAFRAHVRFLASGRVRVAPLEELIQAQDDEDVVSLTFDDGFANVADVALAMLKEYALPATVFVVTDHVGATNAWRGTSSRGIPTLPLMDWPVLGRAAEQGITIGAHTRRHSDLTTLSSAALMDEVLGSAEAISVALGARPAAFAYPYGGVNDEAAHVVREAFSLACTTELRPVSSSDDRAMLPRLDAYYFREAGQLEAWGTAAFRRRLWLRAKGRRVRQLVLDGGGRA